MLASAQLSGLRALLLNPLELSNYSYGAWPQEVPNILNLSQLPRLQYCNSIMQESALQCPNMTRKTGYFYFSSDFQDKRRQQSSAWSYMSIPALQRHPLLLMLMFTPSILFRSNQQACIYYRESIKEVQFLCAIGLTIDGKAQCVHISLYQPCVGLGTAF